LTPPREEKQPVKLSNKPSARLNRRATAYARLARKAILRGELAKARIYRDTQYRLAERAAKEKEAGR